MTGVRLVAEPGAEPLPGSLVVREGRIEMLGGGVAAPPEAIVHHRPGRMIYAGLIEPYLVLPVPEGGARDSGGTWHENPRMRAHARAADALPLPEGRVRELRESGYATALVCPGGGIFRGSSALVSLGDGDPAEEVLVSDFAQIAAFERSTWTDPHYPNSLMGSIALQRQAFLDTEWHRAAWRAWTENGERAPRPAENASLRALEPVLDGDQLVFWESEDLRMLPRALALAREFRLRPVVVSGGGDEYRRPERVRRWLEEAGCDLVLSVAFPAAPRWEGPEEEVAVELDDLVHWERAPTNPRVLERTGVRFAVTTQGLEEPGRVLARLRTAIRHGLSESTALASLTTEPARILGVADRLGTLAPGKAASFLVATGPLFDPGTRIEEVWIDGVRYGSDPKTATESDVKGKWDLVAGADSLRVQINPVRERLEGKVFAGDDTTGTDLTDVELTRGELTFRREAELYSLRLSGRMLEGVRVTDGDTTAADTAAVLGRKTPHEPKEPEDLWTVHSEGAPAWPPLADRSEAPRAVWVRNATVWTLGPAGKREGVDLLAVDGKVRAVGADLDAPGDALVIDGTGKHVTPGLVDCHSHSSISGGVNECTHSATAEVRIGDVIDPWSRAIYRELAGGLTVSNLLHGSCNAIGGQNAVIKLRWGQPAEDLLLEGAPAGIKFALGENVKQSNWGLDPEERTRYPQTRMGVEQFLRERFDAAIAYRADWEAWRADRKRGAPPRRDLQLDALLEILDGERLVHCHSYRSDEIIMLIRVAEDYGFRIGTFQHVLEGYKCADEIAAHGAGASSFSDWWSYKYEVVDAIPYNGEILWKRGVNVSFNSDSQELSRRMNLEGAKAVKYGGLPEEEALAFVSRNPAAQLGIADRVGSLQPGKDADFVVWSAHPLSDAAVCEETWIDGVRRFSRTADREARAQAAELRRTLLEKARDLNRIHDLDPHVKDKGRPVSRTVFGRRFGASEAESGASLDAGLCLPARER